MSKEEEQAKAHEPHQKELQLGVDLDNVPDRGKPIDPEKDPEAIDALWADATDVDTFKSDIEALKGEDPETVEALRQAREG
jgi:hypothetical protein